MSNQSTQNTSKFYDDLVQGKEKRVLLSFEKRFNTDKIINKTLVKEYFTSEVAKIFDKNDVVLDYGCGPGAFLAIASKYCKSIIGVDISSSFVEQTNKTIMKYDLNNAKSKLIKSCNTGFENNTFDKIIMVDVIHHLESISDELKEIHRILKPEGKLIVFEPNKLNPLMFILHVIDKNERGLLRVGSPSAYKKYLNPLFDNINIKYSGLVIAPESKFFIFITKILNSKILFPFLGWLNPKIFFSASKINHK